MKFNTTSFLKRIKISFCILMFSTVFFNINVKEANADFKALTPCKESPAFKKRLKSAVKKLENRLTLYTPESKEAKFLIKEIEATKTRFSRYSEKDSLLCGKEGLPHLITSGQMDRANEYVIPAMFFIYIFGWIGWVGRKYLQFASTQKDPFENEIIIDVPTALPIMNSGFLWPVEFWKEFVNGELFAADEDITVSPR